MTKSEKRQYLYSLGLGLILSGFEMVTAALVVVLAKALHNPGASLLAQYLPAWVNALSPLSRILSVALTLGGVYLIKNALTIFHYFHQNTMIQKMEANFKERLLRKYSHMDYQSYLAHNSVANAHTIRQSSVEVFSKGMTATGTVLSEGMIFFSLVLFALFMNPLLTVSVFFLGAGFYALLSSLVLPKFYTLGKQMREYTRREDHQLVLFFQSFKDMILLRRTENFVQEYKNQGGEYAYLYALRTTFGKLIGVCIELVFVWLFILAIIVLCVRFPSPGDVLSMLGGYLYAGFRLMPSLSRILHELSLLKAATPHIEHIHQVYESLPDQQQYVACPELRFDQAIVFSNVTYTYPQKKDPALQDFSLTIAKGESLGVVGHTGSGKSTFVDLLLGLLSPQQGTALVDNRYPLHSRNWHECIGYVSQAIHLIDDTIEQNIVFGRPFDAQRLEKVIHVAQLSPYIHKLSEGVKSIVGERGIRLSGGERQRIVIARALYQDPSVLILDEATSALDQQTEEQFIKDLYAHYQSRTLIMVAHRLTTLRYCDRILHIEKGRLTQTLAYKDLPPLSS